MAIPEQIRKQDEAVQALYRQLNGETDDADEKKSTELGASGAEDNDAGEADDSDSDSGGLQAQGQSERAPAPKGDDEETLLQKYRTLQGMYNAEVPRLTRDNREMAKRLEQLEKLLSDVSAQQAKPAAAQPVPERYVSEEDVAEYGESLDVMRKVTKEELAPLMAKLSNLDKVIQSLQKDVVPKVEAVSQRQAASSEQQFWQTLTSRVPNWREVNDNPDFQSWLLERDPLTGLSRQTYLEDAQQALDAGRVVNFFTTWMQQNGVEATAQTSGAQKRSAGSELEKQVAPGRSRNSGTPSSKKGKLWSPDDISKFFDDVRKGKYKGREQERDRIERDIFAAQREGRIQLNA